MFVHGKQGQKIKYVQGLFTPTIGISLGLSLLDPRHYARCPGKLIVASNRRLSLLSNCLLWIFAEPLENRRVSWLIPSITLACFGPVSGASLGAITGTTIRNTSKQKKEALTQGEVPMHKCDCDYYVAWAFATEYHVFVLRDCPIDS